MNSYFTKRSWDPEKDIQILSSLRSYMKRLRQDIGMLAGKEDDETLINASEVRLEWAKGIGDRMHSLAVETKNLMDGGEPAGPVAPTRPGVMPPPWPRGVNPAVTPQKQARARGETRRKDYVERQQRAGVVLAPWRGALYKKPDGGIVGIAYASERKRKNFWFLGLPKDKFEEARLLCEINNVTILAVSLLPDFLAKHGHQLGTSQVGQRHFVVERRGRSMYVNVPTVGLVDVSAHVHEYNIDSLL